MERKHISLVGPTILIGLGVILLLTNLGYLDWTIWDALRLWPVLLVAAGLELLLGRRSTWGSVVSALLVLLLVVGGVLLVERVGPVGTQGEVIKIEYPTNATKSFSLEVDPAVADLTVQPLGDSGNLIEGTVELWNTEKLKQRFTEGGSAELILDSDTGSGFNYVGLGQAPDWNLQLSTGVETTINIDLGVGNVDMQLEDLLVENAVVDFGIGQVDIALPNGTASDIRIDGGIGMINLVVPRGLGVRVITDAGLVARSLPNDYSHEGDTYTSPDWSRADYRATVTISLGIGTINVMESAGN